MHVLFQRAIYALDINEIQNVLFNAGHRSAGSNQAPHRLSPGQILDDNDSQACDAPVLRPHIYMDGNFRLPHLQGAGHATQHQPPIQRTFISDSQVQDFCTTRTEQLRMPRATECNDFHADQRLGRTPQKYDRTGTLVQAEADSCTRVWCLLFHDRYAHSCISPCTRVCMKLTDPRSGVHEYFAGMALC